MRLNHDVLIGLAASSLTFCSGDVPYNNLSNDFPAAACPIGYLGESCSQCCNAANMNEPECDANGGGQYYYKDGICESCPPLSSAVLVAVSTAVVLVCLFVAYGYMNTATPAIFYIAIDYLQTLSFLGSTSLPSWPRALRAAFGIFAIINFDLDTTFPPECLFGMSFDSKTIALLVAPIAASLGITALAWFTSAVFRTHRSSNSMIGVAIAIMYFAFLQICYLTIDALKSGKKILIIAGILGVCFYVVGYPLFVWVQLKKECDIIQGDQSFREGNASSVIKCKVLAKKADVLRERFGFLYGAYQSKRWYWAIVVLARRLWLVIVCTLWSRNTIVLGSLLTVMFLIAGTINYRFRPYMMLAQEMAFMSRKLGIEDEFDDAAEDTKYRSLTMRWNVDIVLHSSLVALVILGVVSSVASRSSGDDSSSTGDDFSDSNDWKIEIVLSFIGLLVMGSSLYLLTWAIFSEISRLVRFQPKTKRPAGSFVRRFSSRVQLPSRSGSPDIVPTQAELESNAENSRSLPAPPFPPPLQLEVSDDSCSKE